MKINYLLLREKDYIFNAISSLGTEINKFKGENSESFKAEFDSSIAFIVLKYYILMISTKRSLYLVYFLLRQS